MNLDQLAFRLVLTVPVRQQDQRKAQFECRIRAHGHYDVNASLRTRTWSIMSAFLVMGSK